MNTYYITSSGQWRPTKYFFFQSKRASHIRDLCIQTAQQLDILFTVPSMQDDEKTKIYGQLEALNGKLIALGITSNMHQEKPVEERGEKIKSNPDILAEFLAGQLIPFTGSEIPHESSLACTAQEFSEEKIVGDNGSTGHFISNELPKPPIYMKSLNTRAIINWIDIMMDAEGKVFEHVT